MTVFQGFTDNAGKARLSIGTGALPADTVGFRGLHFTNQGTVHAVTDTGQARFHNTQALVTDINGRLLVSPYEVTLETPVWTIPGGMRTNLGGALMIEDIAPAVINQGVAMDEMGIICYTSLVALRTASGASVVHGIGAVIMAFLADILTPFQTFAQ